MTQVVLLVDDDVEILQLFQHMLRREPYQVEVAPNANVAFNVLESREVAVVVSDERMPGTSGTELLARVQLEYPETVRIMLTGQGSLDVAMRAINEGQVYRFLVKPVRPAELGTAIREALREWELRRSSQPEAVHRARRQEAAIAELENQWQGLTHVERDDSGAIVVPEDAIDLEGVLREATAGAGQRLRR
jgi:DNA-binding NtrC family response regulator